jgi:hypothetical protein
VQIYAVIIFYIIFEMSIFTIHLSPGTLVPRFRRHGFLEEKPSLSLEESERQTKGKLLEHSDLSPARSV